MRKFNDLSSVMETRDHFKNRESFKSHAIRAVFSALVLISGFTICIAQNISSSSQTQNQEIVKSVRKPDVYVAGHIDNHAVLWKNGIAQVLGEGKANSVFVSGNDVYVAGYEEFPLFNAILWKNGVPHVLGKGRANSVFVSGNDVYVAGIQERDATLWKNGVALSLELWGNSVYVSGNDVYVAGIQERVATLWKNGEAKKLTGGEIQKTSNSDGVYHYTTAHSVFVTGNDVYVAGEESYEDNRMENPICIAKLWKNGVAQNLTNESSYAQANSVYVSNNNVYVVGYEKIFLEKPPDLPDEIDNIYIQTAKLWKNGVMQDLGKDEANSVFVSGNDVYIAGSELSEIVDEFGYLLPELVPVAKIWKNGEATFLSKNSSNAASIFVVE